MDAKRSRTQGAQNLRVVVVGGGYAGVTAANALARAGAAVTLVNARPVFVERIRLHQLVGGSDDAVVAFDEVLAGSVDVIVAQVERIDARAGSVLLASGERIGYDRLVYAVGSGLMPARIPGDEHAHPLGDLDDAHALRQALADVTPGAPVAVVGAGPAGIEVAAELAEVGHAVVLYCGGELGPYLRSGARRSVARRLATLGAVVEDGPGSRVTGVRRDAVELADGRILPSAVTILTAGLGVPDLARRSGLTTDAQGRLVTDATLTSVDDERIVAAGDAAAPVGEVVRMSCQAAGPLGAHAAATVLRRSAGNLPEPFRMAFIGQCISLGRRDGIVQFARPDDTPVRVHVSGRIGALLKAFVCWGTVAQLAFGARRVGRRRWALEDASGRRIAVADREGQR